MSDSSDAKELLSYYARRGFSKKKQRDKMRQDLYKQRKNIEGYKMIEADIDSILYPNGRSVDQYIRYAEVKLVEDHFEQATNFSQCTIVYEQAVCIEDDFENFAISEFVEVCEDLELNAIELCQPIDLDILDEDVNVYYVREELGTHVETSLLGSFARKNNILKRKMVGYSRKSIYDKKYFMCDPGDRGNSAFICRQWGSCRLRDSFEEHMVRFDYNEFRERIDFHDPPMLLQLCVDYLPCTERFRLKMFWPNLRIKSCAPRELEMTLLARGKIRSNSLEILREFSFARKPVIGLDCICQTALFRMVVEKPMCIPRVRAKFNHYSRRLIRGSCLFGLKGRIKENPNACFKRKENLASLF